MTEGPPGDVSVSERLGHIEPRPVSWAVVVLVCAGFLAAGIGLIAQAPWLFFVGFGIVVGGTILGWVTHAMADMTARVERAGVPVEQLAATQQSGPTHQLASTQQLADDDLAAH